MSEGSPRIGTQGRARTNLRRLPRPEVRSYYASPSASAVIGWRVAGTIPAAHLLSISVWHGIVSDHQDVQDATLMGVFPIAEHLAAVIPGEVRASDRRSRRDRRVEVQPLKRCRSRARYWPKWRAGRLRGFQTGCFELRGSLLARRLRQKQLLPKPGRGPLRVRAG